MTFLRLQALLKRSINIIEMNSYGLSRLHLPYRETAFYDFPTKFGLFAFSNKSHMDPRSLSILDIKKLSSQCVRKQMPTFSV